MHSEGMLKSQLATICC